MYEDYVQNLFGENYTPYRNTYEPYLDFYQDYENYNYPLQYNYDYNYLNQNNRNLDIEGLYPEIYKIVYPLVKKACNTNTRPLNEELLEKMTQDIYSNLEAGNIINVTINVDDNNSTSKVENRSSASHPNNKVEKTTVPVENRSSENRQFNPIRDLVKILLIKEWFDRPENRPPRPRPPRPGFPPRPDFPPRPPRPGMTGNPPRF